MSTDTVRLLISCPDAKGIIAAVANFVALHNGNILDADQHTDADCGEFFMRIEIDPAGFGLSAQTFSAAWQPLADRFSMLWRVHWGDRRKRTMILVSRQDHCLQDLLWRWRTGELNVDIVAVISNHVDLRSTVFNVAEASSEVVAGNQPHAKGQRESEEQRGSDGEPPEPPRWRHRVVEDRRSRPT